MCVETFIRPEPIIGTYLRVYIVVFVCNCKQFFGLFPTHFLTDSKLHFVAAMHFYKSAVKRVKT